MSFVEEYTKLQRAFIERREKEIPTDLMAAYTKYWTMLEDIDKVKIEANIIKDKAIFDYLVLM